MNETVNDIEIFSLRNSNISLETLVHLFSSLISRYREINNNLLYFMYFSSGVPTIVVATTICTNVLVNGDMSSSMREDVWVWMVTCFFLLAWRHVKLNRAKNAKLLLVLHSLVKTELATIFKNQLKGATSRLGRLEKFSLNFSSLPFVIRVNLLHP